jgi:hypothetical protein
MRSEVVFVQAAGADVDAAISLLTPGRPVARQVVDNGIWTAVTVPLSSGRSLAPALRQALDRTTFLLTVGPEGGTLTLYSRDGQVAGPVDGREQRALADLLNPWRFMRADVVAAALTSTADPLDRLSDVAAAMKVPDPVAPPNTESAGVVVVECPSGPVRGRLAAGGQGAILLPLGTLTAVVADGSGPTPDPVGIAEYATTATGQIDRAVLVSWGPRPAVETWGGARGAPSLAAGLDSGGSTPDSAERAAAVLTGLGLPDVPVGATTEALASWAAAQPGAVRVTAATSGVAVVLPVTDPEQVRTAVRHLRRLRRTQQGLGVAAVAAGAGVAIAWDEVSVPWIGVSAAVLIVCVVLAVVLGRHRRRDAPVPARPRRRVPVARENRVSGPQLPH